MSPIRVLIADDHTIVRSGLRLLMETQADIQVVAEADDADSALAKCQEFHPDVLTLDLSMRGTSPLKILPALRETCPQTRVLVLTMHDDPAYLRAALAAGCQGFLLKSVADEELISALRTVAAGRPYVDLRFRGDAKLGAIASTSGSPAADQKLSERERQVLELLAYGMTNQEIAKRLFLSVKTVETYRARVMEKLRLKTRADVVRYTLSVGILDPNRTVLGDQAPKPD